MKDLFMCLLKSLENYGNITAVNLYKDGKYATLEVESEGSVYTINVYKEEKQNEN